MYATLIKLISSAALSIIIKIASEKIVKEVMVVLVKKTATFLAEKTDNTTDDEIAAIIKKALEE